MTAVAPMRRSSRGAFSPPTSATAKEITIPRAIACTAATAAPRGSFSPVRRATIAVVAMLRPMATPNTMVSMPSVSATVATASVPSRATKKTSTIPNSDSIAISRIMGIASRNTARPMGPSVKSLWVPISASWISRQIWRRARSGVGDMWLARSFELSRTRPI